MLFLGVVISSSLLRHVPPSTLDILFYYEMFYDLCFPCLVVEVGMASCEWSWYWNLLLPFKGTLNVCFLVSMKCKQWTMLMAVFFSSFSSLNTGRLNLAFSERNQTNKQLNTSSRMKMHLCCLPLTVPLTLIAINLVLYFYFNLVFYIFCSNRW